MTLLSKEATAAGLRVQSSDLFFVLRGFRLFSMEGAYALPSAPSQLEAFNATEFSRSCQPPKELWG